jgi:hypothetical protein
MSACHDIDLWEVDDSIEQAEIAFSGNKKNTIHAVVGKNLKQCMARGK